MKVCVLMGGISEEREISLKSGKAVVAALIENGIDAFGFDVQGTEQWLVKHLPKADVYFIALHGKFGEDGQIQAFLENQNLIYTGSGPQASNTAMDKCLSRKAFFSCGIPIAKGFCLFKGNVKDISFEGLKLPLVVKPSKSGSSFGLSIIDSIKNLHDAIEKAFRFSETVIIEEFIKGKEITVGILNGRALMPIEIRPVEGRCFDYESKYTKGKTKYTIPANILPEEQDLSKQTALKAFHCIGCRGFGRVDIILKDGQAYVLEINTIPGMTNLSLLPMAAAYEGINFKDLCKQIVDYTRS